MILFTHSLTINEKQFPNFIESRGFQKAIMAANGQLNSKFSQRFMNLLAVSFGFECHQNTRLF